LLEYYEELGDSVYRMKKNFGHRAFWYSGEVYDRYRKGYFVITDPDIVPCERLPSGFSSYFKKLLDKNPFVKKVGFSLELEDIPARIRSAKKSSTGSRNLENKTAKRRLFGHYRYNIRLVPP
jgi:hypothetical protein